jgi:hypothetical protein
LTKTRSLANYSDRQYVFCVGIVGSTYLDLAQVSDDYFGCDSARIKAAMASFDEDQAR